MSASLLPPVSTPLERAIEAAGARIGDVPVPLRDLWNPATCPIELLPWLAWALSIDTWSPDWPERVKRARVAQAIAVGRAKGTVQSVRDVVAAFGGAISMTEWWQRSPPGDPHTFQLVLALSGADGEQATADYVDQVIAEVQLTKPLRSHFTFTQQSGFAARAALGAWVRPVICARLSFAAPAA